MLSFHVLDVFTKAPFSGNPLAVVLAADGLSDAQMQTITREFNLSETIFVQTPDDPSHTAKVRIFCPAYELPFAGHPTIGCAILLAERAHEGDFECEITLEEVSGLVPVNVSRVGDDIQAEFTAPVLPLLASGTPPSPESAARALGLRPEDIGFAQHLPMHWQGGPDFLYIPIASRAALRKAAPSASWLEMTAKSKTQSVYIYCREDEGYAARMFAPQHGMPEDPATGSASAILAAQLLASGALPEGITRIPLAQGKDMGRPSAIGLTADVQNGALQRIRIKGAAVRVHHGQITALPL
ncbi:MAG: PhzF family phenazine biosynthesis isomerase [Rhodobacteraceae bacterium]|nr:PhzF family phenazine biosynthesis isomerase [Paracoccaceae bacterium]